MTTQMPTADHPSIWSRRNVTIGALLIVGLPFLVAGFTYLTGSDRGFWKDVLTTVSAEAIGAATFMILATSVPRARRSLEIPDPAGDERERLISMKATHRVYTLSSQVLLWIALGLIWVGGKDHMVEIPTGSGIWLLLAMQVTYVGSLIYYNKKL